MALLEIFKTTTLLWYMVLLLLLLRLLLMAQDALHVTRL